ncbi:MAG: cytochrome c [Rhodospirillales bacterium]
MNASRQMLPLLAVCLLIWSIPAAAQDVVETRQQGMQLLQDSVNRLLVLESAPPAAYRPQEVAEQFYIMTEVLKSVSRLFPNSRSSRGGRASPVIWQLRRNFDRLFVEARRQADAGFVAARRMGGARPAVQAALSEIIQTCTSCHAQFLKN